MKVGRSYGETRVDQRRKRVCVQAGGEGALVEKRDKKIMNRESEIEWGVVMDADG